MVRGLTVNQVYGVKSYGGSSPPFGAKIASTLSDTLQDVIKHWACDRVSAMILLGCRQVVCQHAVNVPDKIGGSSPSFPAKSLTERAHFPPVVQVVTLTGCRLDG